MPDLFGLTLLKTALCLGFALWSLLAALNNLTGFRAAASAIMKTVSMAPLRDEPVIATPFDRRAVSGRRMAPLAVVVILVLQAAAACLFGAAAVAFMGLISPTAVLPAEFANTGFALLTVAWFAMLIAGLWFGYWIRQDILQLTHIALLVATLAAALVVNM